MTPEDAGPRTGYTFPRSARLIRRHEFRRVYRRGQRVHGRAFTLVVLRRREPGLRIGLSVAKENGCAVRRNKIKRLIREAFRLERPQLPQGFDFVCIPKVRKGKYALEELRAEFRELLQKADRGEFRGPRRGRGPGRGRGKGPRRRRS